LDRPFSEFSLPRNERLSILTRFPLMAMTCAYCLIRKMPLEPHRTTGFGVDGLQCATRPCKNNEDIVNFPLRVFLSFINQILFHSGSTDRRKHSLSKRVRTVANGARRQGRVPHSISSVLYVLHHRFARFGPSGSSPCEKGMRRACLTGGP